MPVSPTAPESIPKHPIGVVAQRTGLSQDVIRAWERRYGVVQPGRGPGGHRVYSDHDVQRLLLLNTATRAGRSISQIAALPLPELAALVEQDAAALRATDLAPFHAESERVVRSALELTRALEGQQLDETLRRAAASLGVVTFVEHVAAPILRRVGEEWHAGRLTAAHEHLASAVIHDIVADTMRALASRNGAARLVVATPAGERHVIGAALAGAMASVDGWNVIYLGADLPAEDIASAARTAGALVVAVSLVYVDDRKRVLDELRTLRARLPATVSLVAGGAGARQLETALGSSGVGVVESLAEFRSELQRATAAT